MPSATPSTTPRRVAGWELASAVDNPVVTLDGRVESNGNFHGAPVAYVLDFLAIVAADLASISERRTDRFLDVARSNGLPPFLADDPGVDCGHMIAQYTQAAIVSELKRLAAPASVDSIPSSAMQEDHVSMGWSAARKLRRAVDGLSRVLAVEVLTAARGIELRAPLRPGARHRGRRRRPASTPVRAGPGRDRWLSPEIDTALRLVADGTVPPRRRVRDRPPDLTHATPASATPDTARPATDREHPTRRGTGERHGRRPPRARPRGTTLTARQWSTEAALRMLMNNLDPEVAERPDDLVVYGGTGRAARDWKSFDAMVRTLTTLEDDETMLVQSGRPVGRHADPRVGAAGADRQLQPGRRLGHLAGVPPARAPRPDHVRPDDRRLVDLHRHPGHPAGHLRDLRRGRPRSGSAAPWPARSPSPAAAAAWAAPSRWPSP